MFILFFVYFILLVLCFFLLGSSFVMSFCLVLVFLFLRFFWSPFLEVPLWVSYYFCVDYLNVIFISLSVWVLVCMLVVNFNYFFMKVNWSFFLSSLLFMCFVLFLFFSVDNWLLFFIMFELSLIPTFFLVVNWGYQPERLQAGLYMFLYTVVSSLSLLFSLIFLGESFFSLNMSIFGDFVFDFSFFLYFGVSSAFLVKLPMWGVHLWLPKAHVEANVSGSMILAGVLLKLGGYGLLKMGLILYNCINMCYFMLAVSLWSIISVSLVCLLSVDVKQLIAYSSVVHMSFVVAGLFSFSYIGLKGAVIVMVSHGLSSPIMFMLANVIYKMSGSRNLLFHKGVMVSSSGLGICWFLILSANMGAPPSLNFVGELAVGACMVKISFLVIFFVGMMTFLSGVYNLYLFSLTVGFCYGSFNKEVVSSGELLSGFSNVLLVFILFLFCNIF